MPQIPAYPGSAGRTLKDADASNEEFWDGIPVSKYLQNPPWGPDRKLQRHMLKRYHQCAQEMHKFLPPHANKRDIRHPDETVMTYTCEPSAAVTGHAGDGGAEYIRDGVGDAEEIAAERTGVTHLVHAWHQQGHPVCIFYSLFIYRLTGVHLAWQYDSLPRLGRERKFQCPGIHFAIF